MMGGVKLLQVNNFITMTILVYLISSVFVWPRDGMLSYIKERSPSLKVF